MSIMGVESQIDGTPDTVFIEIFISGFIASTERSKGLEARVVIYRCRGIFGVVGASVAISAGALDDASTRLIAPNADVRGRLLGESKANEVDRLLTIVRIGRAPIGDGALATSFCVVIVVIMAGREGRAAGKPWKEARCLRHWECKAHCRARENSDEK